MDIADDAVVIADGWMSRGMVVVLVEAALRLADEERFSEKGSLLIAFISFSRCNAE